VAPDAMRLEAPPHAVNMAVLKEPAVFETDACRITHKRGL
jgi:hypothetical protein